MILLSLVISGFSAPALAQSGFDRRGGDYLSFEITIRRSGRLRRALRTRCALPGLELLLSAHGECTGDLLAEEQVPPRLEDKCCVSGVRGAGVIEPRKGPLEFSIDRVGGDYRYFEVAADPTGATCKTACEDENKLPRLDLCAARLHHAVPALLSERQDQAAAPQAVLHFGGGEVTFVMPGESGASSNH